MTAAPKLRTDLVFVEQTYRGVQSFIVKDPTTHKYFRFGPAEIRVMRSLDGLRSPAEAAAALVEEGLRVSAGAVEKFAAKLKTMGLCERTLGERSTLLVERLRAERRRRLKPPLFKGELLRMRWSFGDPDAMLNRWMPRLRFFFSPLFLALSVVLFGLYFVVLALKWTELSAWMSALYHFELSIGTLVAFYVTAMVIIAIHELGHGVTCKHFGGEVHEIGAMLLYFEPAFFCNVNDAWTFPDLKARLWVTAAGSWIQLVLASLGAIVWWAAAPGTLISEIGLASVLIGGVTTVAINANPLMPLDGYYALSDYLEVPNLRQRAFTYLSWVVKARVLGLELPAPPATEREQRIFLVYSALATLYIASVFSMVGLTVLGWAGRALGILGFVLVAGGIGLMLRAPAIEWGQAILAAGRQWRAARDPARRRWRLPAAVALVVLLGAVIPRGITVVGRFTAAPVFTAPLTAPEEGFVERILVGEGGAVAPGAPVARIRNLGLERGAVVSRRVVDSLSIIEARSRGLERPGDLARARAERAAEEARLNGTERRLATLTLRAPRAGVVVTPHPQEAIGRWVEAGEPVVALGRPDSIELRVALAGAGASLVRPGMPVAAVWHADPAAKLTGRVASVSTSAARSSDAPVEARVALAADARWRAGMTGEASVTLRQSNLWGALWWAVRRRIRSDLFL